MKRDRSTEMGLKEELSTIQGQVRTAAGEGPTGHSQGLEDRCQDTVRECGRVQSSFHTSGFFFFFRKILFFIHFPQK